MKVVNLSNPVTSAWLADQGFRLDAKPYLSGALEARKLLERLPNTVPLSSLTAGHDGGIFNGPMFRRTYLTEREHSVPFLGSKDMMASDLTNLPRLRKTDAASPRLAYLRLKPGMTLISCSGFHAGRRSYVRPDMGDIWSSQDVLKVEANPDEIKSGYLYAFLAGKFGEVFIKGSVYGAAVKHIEPYHIANLPVPRLGADLETEIHDLIQEASECRARFQAGVVGATQDLFTSAGLSELLDLKWHQQPRDVGFYVPRVNATSLRALNFAPRVRRIMEKLESVPYCTLGDICDGGVLSRGQRFKRVDSDPEHGVKLVGQRQGFWMRPEGRWISLSSEEIAGVKAQDETTMIASQGTHGENEVFCRAFFVTGSWQRNSAFSEHFLRVLPATDDFPGAYLFAFLRSEPAFRMLRSLSAGSKQQDIHEVLRRKIPVPECKPADRSRIAETVRDAYRDRDRADELEDRALALLDDAVREAAG